MTTDATNEDDDDNDCWDVFGSDDGDDNNDVGDDDYWEAFGSDDDDDDDNGDDVDNSNSNSSNAMGVKVLQVNQVATAASGTATAISVQVDNKKEMKKKNEQQQQWKKVASSIASYLSQSFLKHNSQIRLSERYVLLYVDADCTTADDGNNKRNGEELETRISVLSKYLKQRQIQVDVIRQQQQQQQSKDDIIINSSSVDMDMDVVDAVIILDDMQDHHHHSYHQKKIIIESRLRPGGILLYSMITTTTTANGNDNKNKNKNERSSVIIATHDFTTKDKDIDKLLVQSTTTTNTDNNSKTNTINTASVLHTYKLFFLDDRTTTTKTTINTTQQHCQWMVRQRKIIRVHATTCPWLSSSSHSLRLQREEEHLQLATVDLSAHEIRVSTTTVPAIMITEPMIQKSVRNIQQYGYCILPKVLAPSPCYAWGRAVLECVHDAAHILKHRDHIDLYNPQSSQADPASYQELSMREDLRLDLRHGPALDKIRQKQQCYHNNTDNENNNDDDDVGAERTKQKRIIGNKSIVVSSSTQQDGTGIEFLRGQSSLLEIILRTMNPHNDTDDTNDNDDSNNKLKLWLGNIGRWNFNGCGNDGSYQNLRLSPVGGIVSLPGSADQALHADTSHLFEHMSNMPAHYINVFAPCTDFNEQVGGTAFIHGSHNLEFTARHYGNNNNNDNSSLYPYLVRPKLDVGDVVLFDCRILHFGLANTSKSIERCICYMNCWHDWFHDAKNWDQNRSIFQNNDVKDTITVNDGDLKKEAAPNHE